MQVKVFRAQDASLGARLPGVVADTNFSWPVIAARIRELIAKSDRGKQAAIAARLEVSEGVVSRYVSGKARPPIEALPQIADILGVSLQELLMGKPEPSTPADDRLSKIAALAETMTVQMAEMARLLREVSGTKSGDPPAPAKDKERATSRR